MVLPASGPLSFSDIRFELTGIGSELIPLAVAETGSVDGTNGARVNLCSEFKPNRVTPSSVSEWYRYNHAATASLAYQLEGPTATSADACDGPAVGTIDIYLAENLIYYLNSSCVTVVSDGYYADASFINYYRFQSGQLAEGPTACGTTTTTTTTTLGTGTCYQTTNGNGSNPITVQWTDRTGTIRTGSLAASTTVYLCSITTPTQLPSDVDISVSTCTNAGATPCTITCTTIGCKQCADAGNCF